VVIRARQAHLPEPVERFLSGFRIVRAFLSMS